VSGEENHRRRGCRDRGRHDPVAQAEIEPGPDASVAGLIDKSYAATRLS